MLQSIRSAVSSWFVKVLLAALVLSFVSFYGWQAGTDLSPGIVATVNGENISSRDLQLRFQSVIQNYRNLGLLKDKIPPHMMNLLQQNVLNAMIDQHLKSKAAQHMGLFASPQQIRESIKKQFSDESGNFDFELYKNFIKHRLGKTTAAFEEDEARIQLSLAFDNLLERTAFVTDEELKLTYQIRNEKAALFFTELDPTKIPNISRSFADEKALEEYLSSHPEQYRIQERRKLEIAWASMDDFIKPNEAELKEILESQSEEASAGKNEEERIRAAHILIRTNKENLKQKKKQAQDLYKKIENGADFFRLARAESEDSSRIEGGDLGYFSRGKMVKEFEEEAFSLKVGETSKPVKSTHGFHIIRLLDHIPAGPATVKRLRPELIYEWKKKIRGDLDRLEPFLSSAENLLKQARKKTKDKSLAEFGDPRIYSFLTSPVSTGDQIPELPNFKDNSLIIRKGQDLSPNEFSDPIRSTSLEYVYLVRTKSIQPSYVPQLEEVRDQVKKDYLSYQKKTALERYAKELLAKWQKSKKPFPELSKPKGLEVHETDEFTRSSNYRISKVGISKYAMSQAFHRPLNDPLLPEPVKIEDKTYLMAVSKRIAPNWDLFKKEKENLRQALQGEASRYRAQFWSSKLKENAKINLAQASEKN